MATAPIRLPLTASGVTLGLLRRPVTVASRLADPAVTRIATELTEGLGRELSALVDPRRMRTQRRVTVHGNRIHAEVRGLRSARSARVAELVHKHLEQEPAVDRFQVNAATGRVMVAAEPQCLSPAQLETILERVEDLAGTSDEPWNREFEHPSDREPIVTSALQLAGDVIGIGAAVTGRLLPAPPPAHVVRGVVALVDGQPRLRGTVEAQLGRHRADTVISIGNAVGQALDSEVTGLCTDAVQRLVRLVEAAARFAQWRRWEQLIADADLPGVDEYDPPEPRPIALPRGPIERCTEQAGAAAVVASAATLAGGRAVADAADAVAAGVPKAARAGRETFAGAMSTLMAARGVLTLDPLMWRRLDRVSAVIVDRDAVRGQRAVVLDAESRDDSWPVEHVWSAAQRLLRRNGEELPIPPPPEHRRENLHLGIDADPRPGVATDPSGSGFDSGGPRWHLLHEYGRVVGRALIGNEPHPGAVGLLATARQAGLRVVLIGDEGTGELRRSADEFVLTGGSVSELVRRLQQQGHVVAVVSGHAHRALGAADLGIGIATCTRGVPTQIPWQADVVCPDPGSARQIIAATGRARDVSDRGRVLTLSAGTLSGLLLASGPAESRAARATSPIAAATLMGLITGLSSGRRAANAAGPAEVRLVPWHALEPDEVLARLPAPHRPTPPPRSHAGAATSRLSRRLATPATSLAGLVADVRRELADPMTPILGVGAVASALLGSPTDAVLVGTVLGLNATVSALQRRRARVSLDKLLLGERLTARRLTGDGEIRTPADDLLPGDVIALATGEVVPADARLLETDGLEVDESGLTGEAVTVEKQTPATPGALLAERTGMVFEGSVVVSGDATAVVVAVGTATEAGRALATAAPPPTGGVQEQLHSLTRRVLPFTLSGGTAVTVTSFLRGLPLRAALADGLAVAVAAVPEGLPLVATVAQLAATRRLSRRGVLVRSSRTIEALGRIDTMCFDKTGTLTEGQLRLVAVADLDQQWDRDDFASTPQSRELLRAAAHACPNPEDSPLVHATDRAVVEAAHTHLGHRPPHAWDRIDEVPFESFRGYSAAVGNTGLHIRLAVKGAPEVLLPRCDQVLCTDNEGRPRISGFTPKSRTAAETAVRRLAAQGLRVLVVARRDFASAPDDVTEEIEQLTLLGFLGIADSPRPQALELLAELARNDISVRMITGDHPITARAVAEQLAIPADTVATGADLDALDEDGQAELIEQATVFARVSPEHKVRIVSALQRRGHTVAMAGDGSNDAAAIRTADVGIGLAARGSVAAREAADLILTDTGSVLDLTVLLETLAEGRGMWQRVRDAIGVLVGGNAGEVAFTVLGTLLSGRAPIGTRQFLVVNLLTDLGPAMALTLADTRPVDDTDTADTTLGPPPGIGTEFLQAVAVRGTCTTLGAGAAWLLGRATGRRRRADTMALAALIGTQLGQTLVIGRHSSLVWTTVAASSAVLAAIIMTPGVNRFFGCVPLGPVAWSIVLGCTATGTGAALLAGRALSEPQAADVR
ncbi:cation-translocating P-type ATPase [Nocardia sp. CA2R105]|uniref:HAD-IC family P-type ATPase n=1 Tax=Nocardia coffeae TaxID=2873381 RepID=UPI001CA62B17|nr:HAD-IC family P-type ATPase [Nocardia coffeae]MBY8861286.1 cation-translocating P-type ATPase [Nocardia coffeae]